MNLFKNFLLFAIFFFAIIWLFNYLKLHQLQDRYDKAIQEHERLLEEISNDSCKIDSLQYVVDSLTTRYLKLELELKKPIKRDIDLINAIIHIESRGNDNAYNASEDAVGCLQIRKCMVDDVNRILKRKNSLIQYSYEDRWNRDMSIEMFNIFTDYYKLTSFEEIARCWNGGPRGIDNPYTLGYWNRVETKLEEGYASK